MDINTCIYCLGMETKTNHLIKRHSIVLKDLEQLNVTSLLNTKFKTIETVVIMWLTATTTKKYKYDYFNRWFQGSIWTTELATWQTPLLSWVTQAWLSLHLTFFRFCCRLKEDLLETIVSILLEEIDTPDV